MLTITNTAYARLSELLAEHPDDVAVRIVRRSGRLKLRRGTQRPDDEVFQYSGRTVLLVAPKAAKHVGRKKLIVRDTDGGPRLRLKRVAPKTQS